MHDNLVTAELIQFFFTTDILIDHLGKLKFSDFGAAKILAKGQKTMGKTTMNVNVNSLTGTPMYMVRIMLLNVRVVTAGIHLHRLILDISIIRLI